MICRFVSIFICLASIAWADAPVPKGGMFNTDFCDDPVGAVCANIGTSPLGRAVRINALVDGLVKKAVEHTAAILGRDPKTFKIEDLKTMSVWDQTRGQTMFTGKLNELVRKEITDVQHAVFAKQTANLKKYLKAAIDSHIPLIEEAGRTGVRIIGLQEVFNGPCFCPSQDVSWYDIVEALPGPPTELMAQYAKKYQMTMVVPVDEREQRRVWQFYRDRRPKTYGSMAEQLP